MTGDASYKPGTGGEMHDLLGKSPDPFRVLENWFDERNALHLREPDAVTLATVDADGIPDARVVLVKTWDNAGFQFFTNMNSRKGVSLKAHPVATLLYYWDALHRQVRITGTVVPLSPEASDAYWAQRAPRSQAASRLSPQSHPISSPEDFEAQVDAYMEAEGAPNLQRPAHWHGLALRPHRIEFWDGGANRIHRRRLFESVVVTDDDAAARDKTWITSWLAP